MLLAVDIGNSQTSFGLFDGARLRQHWRLDSRTCATADGYAASLFSLFSAAKVLSGSIQMVALCSVVPSADREFKQFISSYLRCPWFEIEYSMPLGFRLNVDSPKEVGADRLANAEYACRRLKLPCIVVDFGTATTLDVVVPGTERPSYEGGVILPGVGIAVGALSTSASKLPPVELEFPSRVIGRATKSCIQSGLLYGYTDMVDGLLGRVESEIKARCEVVLTGGLGSLFQGRLTHETDYRPDLTLEGVYFIHERRERARIPPVSMLTE